MILRKPYAFFIRHFKLIHVIMTVLLGYLILKTNLILNFLNTYMKAKELVTGMELVKPLFSVTIYIITGLLLLLSIMIIVLMNFKKKPFTFYFVNALFALMLFFIFYFSQTIVGTMEKSVVSLKTIRLIRDFLTIAILLETTSLLVCFIRSVGFNLQHFNFEKDYKELNITNEDNEEFELELSVDTDSLRRRWVKRIRYFKYVYREHRFLINLLILLFILGLVFAVSFVLGMFEKKFKENELFTTEHYIMGIKESYVVTTDYKGKMIKDGSKFIVVKINLKNRFEVENKFVTVSSYLMKDEDKIYYQSGYSNNFNDLGVVYNDQLLSNEATDYLLVYEVPSDYDITDLVFIFQNIGDRTTYEVKLNPKILGGDNIVKDYPLGEKISINDTIKADVLINNYELSNRFKLNYNFCVNDSECYDSVEYLYPTLSGRTNKALLKLNGKVELKDDSMGKIKGLNSFINMFGTIEYTVNGEVKRQSGDFNRVEPISFKSSDYYIEVNEEILNAEKVYLDFVIRNKTYRYLLK